MLRYVSDFLTLHSRLKSINKSTHMEICFLFYKTQLETVLLPLRVMFIEKALIIAAVRESLL